MALVGLARLARAHLAHAAVEPGTLSRIALVPRTVAVVVGTRDLERGSDAGSPGSAAPNRHLAVAVVFVAGLVLNGVNAYMTVATRRIPEFYISNWYILGGVAPNPHYFRHRRRPRCISAATPPLVLGYLRHTAVGLRFTMLSPGIASHQYPEGPGPALFLRARFSSGHEYPLLHPDRRTPLHLQSHPLVAADHGDPVQRGDGRCGLGGRRQPAPDLPGRLGGVPAELLKKKKNLLIFSPGLSHAGHARGIPLRERLLALHQRDRRALSHLAMYGFDGFSDLGRGFQSSARAHRLEPNPILVGVHFWLALVAT